MPKMAKNMDIVLQATCKGHQQRGRGDHQYHGRCDPCHTPSCVNLFVLRAGLLIQCVHPGSRHPTSLYLTPAFSSSCGVIKAAVWS